MPEKGENLTFIIVNCVTAKHTENKTHSQEKKLTEAMLEEPRHWDY